MGDSHTGISSLALRGHACPPCCSEFWVQATDEFSSLPSPFFTFFPSSPPPFPFWDRQACCLLLLLSLNAKIQGIWQHIRPKLFLDRPPHAACFPQCLTSTHLLLPLPWRSPLPHSHPVSSLLGMLEYYLTPPQFPSHPSHSVWACVITASPSGHRLHEDGDLACLVSQLSPASCSESGHSRNTTNTQWLHPPHTHTQDFAFWTNPVVIQVVPRSSHVDLGLEMTLPGIHLTTKLPKLFFFFWHKSSFKIRMHWHSIDRRFRDTMGIWFIVMPEKSTTEL